MTIPSTDCPLMCEKLICLPSHCSLLLFFHIPVRGGAFLCFSVAVFTGEDTEHLLEALAKVAGGEETDHQCHLADGVVGLGKQVGGMFQTYIT